MIDNTNPAAGRRPQAVPAKRPASIEPVSIEPVSIENDGDLERGVRALRDMCTVMCKVHDATGLPPLRRTAPGFEGLARIIVGQQVSVASAAAIWARCKARISPMQAATVRRLDDEALRSAGLSRPKIKTLRAAAEAVVRDGLDLTDFGAADDDQVRARLTAISGIGPWTADLYLLACLGRPDVFAAGDLALQVATQHAFQLEQRPGRDELEDIAQRWRPWRAVAARLLWAYYRIVRDPKSGMPL